MAVDSVWKESRRSLKVKEKSEDCSNESVRVSGEDKKVFRNIQFIKKVKNGGLDSFKNLEMPGVKYWGEELPIRKRKWPTGCRRYWVVQGEYRRISKKDSGDQRTTTKITLPQGRISEGEVIYKFLGLSRAKPVKGDESVSCFSVRWRCCLAVDMPWYFSKTQQVLQDRKVVYLNRAVYI